MKWYIIIEQNNDQTYLIWGLRTTNYDYKHNDLKWNIID